MEQTVCLSGSIIRVMTSLRLCTKRGAAQRYDWQSPLNSLSSLSVSVSAESFALSITILLSAGFLMCWGHSR